MVFCRQHEVNKAVTSVYVLPESESLNEDTDGCVTHTTPIKKRPHTHTPKT